MPASRRPALPSQPDASARVRLALLWPSCWACSTKLGSDPAHRCARPSPSAKCAECTRSHKPCKPIPPAFLRAARRLQDAAVAAAAAPENEAAQEMCSTMARRLHRAMLAAARSRRVAGATPVDLRQFELLELMLEVMLEMRDLMRYENRFAALPTEDDDGE